jgi:hypothetical protein
MATSIAAYLLAATTATAQRLGYAFATTPCGTQATPYGTASTEGKTGPAFIVVFFFFIAITFTVTNLGWFHTGLRDVWVEITTPYNCTGLRSSICVRWAFN